MVAVTLEHLEHLYSSTDDPWNFRTSDYEKRRIESIASVMEKPCYAQILEIGCGNGELARELSKKTRRYVGLDASRAALQSASRVVPEGEFMERFLPCELPDGEFEMIVLSEILYFLDEAGIAALAAQLQARWPTAELLCVNYLGPSGNHLQGSDALDAFRQALAADVWHERLLVTEDYRIDRFRKTGGPGAIT